MRVLSKAAHATGEGRGGSMRFPRSGGSMSKQHRGQVSVTQFEAKIPAKAEENDVVFESTAGK